MRLAWQCGHPHADHLLDTLTPEQVTDVLAFAELQPLADARADLRAAKLAYTFAGTMGGRLTLRDYAALFDSTAADDDGTAAAPGTATTPDQMDRAFARQNALRRGP